MRYLVDRRVDRRDGGRVALGGDPMTLMRLSEGGAMALSRWSAGGADGDAATPAERRLIDRLAAAGMMHPCPRPVEPDVVARLTVVVPVRDRAERLDECLAALVRSGIGDLVVVDDGSVDDAAHRRVVERHGGELVRSDHPGGPAAARTAGWEAVRSRAVLPPVVAFVDSDIVVSPSWAGQLLGHFDAPAVALVAPRVRHARAMSLLDRYESASSPLDLGPDASAIAPGTRVAYVPAAALLVRSSAFAAVGGFDVELVVGEDVDLVWRLVGDGWVCRYAPDAEVAHHGRARLGELLRRRYDYGRSAAPLERRHPGALPPVRASPWSAAVVGLVATGHPVLASGLAGWTARTMAGRLSDVDGGARLAARFTAAGHLGAARQLARALVRPWLPVSIAAAAISRRARTALLLGAIVVPAMAWRDRRPRCSLPVWTALWLADEVAYTAGVWAGCARERSWRVLVPRRS